MFLFSIDFPNSFFIKNKNKNAVFNLEFSRKAYASMGGQSAEKKHLKLSFIKSYALADVVLKDNLRYQLKNTMSLGCFSSEYSIKTP